LEEEDKSEKTNALDKVVPQGTDGVLHDLQGEANGHGVINKETLALLLSVEGLLGDEMGETPIAFFLCESVVGL